MIAAAAGRSILRSPCLRGAASRSGSVRPSLFRSVPKQRHPSAAVRFHRSPVEASFCVESMLPMHNATASALMTSMLTISRRGCGWLSEGNCAYY
ncbi:protein NUCLEAR FUSION DEFECTIVE 6, mitochondrial-like isoform X1 [Zingiber officinale]|uniref:protein NUCLEAR FUSION DEFECTIVE 6, mitochondrial-like isoform X1 n=1 Tax=Zingiber officinale TaxID=94328 RepID=UPI001C4D05D5|nr:protein NUCLEAR FUSION DEFECTIVE 6, mitochondrial-like isoform X1 [Zingiber officinale]